MAKPELAVEATLAHALGCLMQLSAAKLGLNDVSRTNHEEREALQGAYTVLWIAIELAVRPIASEASAVAGHEGEAADLLRRSLGLVDQADRELQLLQAELQSARARDLLNVEPVIFGLGSELVELSELAQLITSLAKTHELRAFTNWLCDGAVLGRLVAMLALLIWAELRRRELIAPSLKPPSGDGIDLSTRRVLLQCSDRWYAASAAVARSAHAPREHSSASCIKRIDDNVEFTLYRPRQIIVQVWTKFLVFAHLSNRRPDANPDEPGPGARVKLEAAAALGKDLAAYEVRSEDASQSIPFEGQITFVPRVPGVEFDPERFAFRWVDDVHRAEFRMRASNELAGSLARGELLVFLGGIVVAELALRFEVRTHASAALELELDDAVSARVYRKIFVSYSHRDRHIVDHITSVGESLGDRYLIDHRDLRAGEEWSPALKQMIDEADAFQLFWSTHSMRSDFVRQEWQYALSLGRRSFVRPTYWELPLPELPEQDLPPAELRRMHFFALTGLPIAAPKPDANQGVAGPANPYPTLALGAAAPASIQGPATAQTPVSKPAGRVAVRRRHELWTALASAVAGFLLVLKTGSLEEQGTASEQLLAMAEKARGQAEIPSPWGRRKPPDMVVPEFDAHSAGAACCWIAGVMFIALERRRPASRSAR